MVALRSWNRSNVCITPSFSG